MILGESTKKQRFIVAWVLSESQDNAMTGFLKKSL